MSSVLDQIVLYQRKLKKYSAANETDKLLYYIHKLKHLSIRVSHLEETGVGRSVNVLRQHKGIVADKAKQLVNKWKDMVNEEEEEEVEEDDDDEEAEEGGGGYEDNAQQLEDAQPENQEIEDVEEEDEEEEEDRLQIQEEQDNNRDYEDNHSIYEAVSRGYGGYEEGDTLSDDDCYNPLTSQQDYQSQADTVSTEYHPSVCTTVKDSDPHDSTEWQDTPVHDTHDRKNGSSKVKKSSKSEKERKDKDRHKDKREGHKKEKKKEHKHKHREDKKEDKKPHKDKHRNKEEHSGKVKEKHRNEDEKARAKMSVPVDEIANGFSSPEVERHPNKSRESDKRGVDEKRKEKSERSTHRKENGESSKLSEKDIERTSSSKDKINSNSSSSSSVNKEKRKKDKHKDKNSSSSSSEKKDKHNRESEHKKHSEEKSRKESKKRKNKVEDDVGFGAALMGPESHVKKKKKKKKDVEKIRESSDDEKPSTSSSNKRPLSDDEEKIPEPKKPKLLVNSPQKLPKLPPVIPDEKPFLPDITPNYKPLPRVAVKDDMNSGLSKLTEEEALNIMFQSKNKRSKMYSGKCSGLAYVPSLFEICIRSMQDNIDALEYTGGVPFTILRPVLERASPQQLLSLEDFNSYLLEDTHVLWETHCKKDFRNKKREEMETWRDMWLRCFDERERKLKSLTQNLQQKFVSNSEPKRTTKLAFIGSNIKVPKNVARAQAKFGTAPPAAVAAKPGKAGEVAARKAAMQNAQKAERANHPKPTSAKNKKVAPLMAKTRQFFRKAFRR